MHNNILVICGHPNLKESTANSQILKKLEKELPGIDILRLDEVYPDYNIDVSKEQQRLLDHDTIILQFPIFWYTAPSLMKRYIDDLFSHGFAIGSKGGKLKGKKLMLSVTTAGDESIYQHNGYTKRTIDEFLFSYDVMAFSSQMIKLPNVCTYEIGYLAHSGKDPKKVDERTSIHVKKILEILKNPTPVLFETEFNPVIEKKENS